jgi:GNAT superfamily N-acetyltransferase
MFKIILANTPELLKIVRKLDRRCFPNDDPVNIDSAIYYLAYDLKGNPVGFGGIVLHGTTWFLRRAGVVKSARRKGLQKLLIQARVRFARRYRPDYPISTYTVHDNVASQRSLIACGFKPYRPTELYGGASCVYWIKRSLYEND